jgi:hypothetical protein
MAWKKSAVSAFADFSRASIEFMDMLSKTSFWAWRGFREKRLLPQLSGSMRFECPVVILAHVGHLNALFSSASAKSPKSCACEHSGERAL